MGFLVSNMLWVFGGKELWETGHSYSLVCHSHHCLEEKST